MTHAFGQLKHGRPGPVLLELPEDLLEEEFSGDLDKYTPVRKHLSAADPEDIRDLITAILKSSCPVINAGQGILYAEATNDLIEFANLTNIPVLTTLAGKSAFPENHPLSLGTGAHSATKMVDHFLKKTDFVLGIGTSFNISHFNTPMPTGVTIAQSTNCPEDISSHYNISYGAIGDSKIVLRQMIDEVKRQTTRKGRADTNGCIKEIGKIKDSFMKEWSPKLTSDEVPMNPYRIFTELYKEVDVSNTMITHDSGYPREQLVPFWETVTPRGYIGWGKSTQLGYGLGLAIGAKLAAPEKNSINIMGDAAFGMAAMDVETAARNKIGILTIILNNSGMTNYDHHMGYAAERWETNNLSGDYTKISEGLGAYAERVDTPDQIGPAIRNALAANQNGQPAVLEMITKHEESVSSFV